MIASLLMLELRKAAGSPVQTLVSFGGHLFLCRPAPH